MKSPILILSAGVVVIALLCWLTRSGSKNKRAEVCRQTTRNGGRARIDNSATKEDGGQADDKASRL